jgi:hypothetical protein
LEIVIREDTNHGRGAIAAYSFFPKKPSIKRDIEETNPKLIQAFKKQLFLAA